MAAVVSVTKFERAVSILEDDAFRCEGALAYDRILALAQKFELTADELVALRTRMLELEVIIEGDPLAEAADAPPAAPASAIALAATIHDELPEFTSALNSYLAEAGEAVLLRPHEEVEFMRRIRTGDRAAERLRAGGGDPDGSLHRLVADGREARRRFVEANLRLTIAVAKTTNAGQLAFEDLVQEGNLGLLKAVEMFDHERGLRFSTYATWWIWSTMLRAVVDKGKLVRVPAHLHDRLRRALKAQTALTKERDGVAPSTEDLSKHLGWGPEIVQFLLDMNSPHVSLDATIDADETTTFGDAMASREANAEERTGNRQLLCEVASAIDRLDPREKFVMGLRFGLSDGEEHTLKDIGDRMDVSRERVRQIQNDALEHLRHPARSKALAELLAGRRKPNTSTKDPKDASDAED